MGKNLEAIDQAYKGIFRTPFAFLFGGPVGLIANAAYTAYKVNDEIKSKEKFQKWFDDQFIKEPSFQEKYSSFIKNINDENNKEILIKEYLNIQFDDTKDFNKIYNCYYQVFKSDKSTRKFTLIPKQSNINNKYYNLIEFVADYLPYECFAECFKRDLENHNIETVGYFYKKTKICLYKKKTITNSNEKWVFTTI